MEDIVGVGVDSGCLRVFCFSWVSQRVIGIRGWLLFIAYDIYIFGLAPGYSSFSLIVGPPGTDKTNCIFVIIGALLHHSKTKYFFPNQRHNTGLQINDSETSKPVYFSNNHFGIHILISCSGKDTVDDIAMKVRQGIPDTSNNRRFVPAMARIACQGYSYRDLNDISLHNLALLYIDEYFHVDEKGSRSNPSKKALVQVTKASIHFFSTCSTAGSNILST